MVSSLNYVRLDIMTALCHSRFNPFFRKFYTIQPKEKQSSRVSFFLGFLNFVPVTFISGRLVKEAVVLPAPLQPAMM